MSRNIGETEDVKRDSGSVVLLTPERTERSRDA